MRGPIHIRGGYAMHLVNYSMNEETKCVGRVDEMTFTLDFDAKVAAVIPFPDEGVEAKLDGKPLTVRNIGLYKIVKLAAE